MAAMLSAQGATGKTGEGQKAQGKVFSNMMNCMNI